MLMTGVPKFMRLVTGLRRPKNRVPGTDVAGTVEAVGNHVTTLRPGDEVFGWCTGGFAEYAHARENQFVRKPANLSFEQAAAVGVSATTALQQLRDDAKIKPGQKVLINGASGGVGTFAVQIRQGVRCRGDRRMQHQKRGHGAFLSAPTTSSTTPKKTSPKAGPRYDFILDNVGNHSLSQPDAP
jgi:NADPH:quinone reductase-like Zn-dependent oxidoreductase